MAARCRACGVGFGAWVGKGWQGCRHLVSKQDQTSNEPGQLYQVMIHNIVCNSQQAHRHQAQPGFM